MKPTSFKVYNSSVEDEDQGYDPNVVPFNPNLIKIRREVLTLSQLVDMMDNDEINFQTSFQRNRDLWDELKQSRLIESLILRLPLPSFYFDEIKVNDGVFEEQKVKWEVIDGLQRCSTFHNFLLLKSLRLSGLEFLKTLEGKSFDELPREMQRRINQSQLSINIVEDGTPETVKFNIFRRINTAGLVLNPQEIRHAMFQGIAANTITELALGDSFKSATLNKIPTERMEDKDFVTRYVGFYLQSFTSYQPDFDSFLTKGMELLSRLSQVELEALKSDFDKAMSLAKDLFGKNAFRRRPLTKKRQMPINKPLFEVISSCFAHLSDHERAVLSAHKDAFLADYHTLEDNPLFVRSISAGTGQRQSVLTRFQKVSQIITKTLMEYDN